MKKGIFVLVCVFLAIFSQTEINNIESIPENAKSFIEQVADESEIILTNEEIQDYNNEIKQKTNMIYDLEQVEGIKGIVIKRANLRTVPSEMSRKRRKI